jgi:hypothetical protein
MESYYLIYNICIKFFLFILIINLILEKGSHHKEIKDLEDYFSLSICQLLYFTINYKCSTNFHLNNNFYNDILEINNNINLFINIKKSQLENILLLLGIVPFLKNKSTLFYKINDKEVYIFFKKIFNKKIKYKMIKLDYNDLLSFNINLKKLLYYKWKLIPTKSVLDNLRHIINNYYNETNLDLFQKSLNINYKSFIYDKINKMTDEEIQNLLSKFNINNLFIKKKILEYMKKINV